ncbi:cAMP-binding domain of CRP or a regulatory subunit of cAMP-dependent protein kinases [Cognatiyoonia koreensis]|uniref:cAMP-binding domain of CRP or a regulatory subunit of cAMP-dependent protein kinases n=1 Tax=Cognatiyoonia koreensis TaxID=364200 RepID=A0A1I0RP18_9RHOB|nr:Crp/Fnr family transcriptional regulator [Cognatiyoonia koreensis]SEW42793.1 cAMP-binding domain of CRP or a regulatory subunit of cAMP-dependent protein kinases [Cognatiyoonia koreensis]
MDPADSRDLFADAKRRSFAAGEMLFAEGEPGDMVMLIEKGRVEVSVTSLSGRKSVLAHMGPGEVLGEIAALDGGTRSADTVAASAVEGLVVSRQNILAFVAERSDVAQAIITELCRKVRNASDMFTTQSAPEGSTRLARALLRLFDKWGERDNGRLRLSERFSQAEIGEFSGLARENVNRHIKAWADEGIVIVERRQLFLLDRGRLAALADI